MARKNRSNTKPDKVQEFIAFTDGSSDWFHPQKPGGSAYMIMDTDGNIIKKMSKGFLNTTTNRMELLAIISAVNSVPDGSYLKVYTDSKYCIMALLSKEPKANLDLIKQYYDIRCKKEVTVFLEWVKGHNGNPYNEECDRMAKAEFEKKAYGQVLTVPEPGPLPPDTIIVPVDNIKPKKKRSTKKKK